MAAGHSRALMVAAVSLDDLVKTAFDRHRAGDLDGAEAAYLEVIAQDREHLNALQLLGSLWITAGRAAEAVTALERAVALAEAQGLRAEHASLYNNLGNALGATGRASEAVARYRKSLELAPGNAEVHANLATELFTQGDIAGAITNYQAAVAAAPRPDWLHQLGKAHAAAGRDPEAADSYRAALKAAPGFAPALLDLGLALSRDQPQEAVKLFERLRIADPAHVDVHRLLGNVFRILNKRDRAIASYRRYLACMPDSPAAQLYLGTMLSESARNDEAIVHLKQAIALATTTSVVAHIELGNAMLRMREPGEAQILFRRAAALQPLITRKAAQPARFQLLAVMAPGVANIPYDYLIGRSDYDAHFMWFVAEGDYDLADLRAHADVVINLISDADRGRAALPDAAALIDRLERPVVNHPRLVARSDRVAVAETAAQIAGCRAARVMRFKGEDLLADTLPDAITAFGLPFLVRVAGLHGGEAFEKIDDPAALRAFVAVLPPADYYLMDYLDYQSADGLFRKYRFFYVDGQVLPYHLAIGAAWKLHYFRTDMAYHVWMQQEEEAFLAHPEKVFGPSRMATLHAIGARSGLGYMGIDCALDRAGNVVLFEANAAMLVHDNNHGAAYKTPHARRIKSAFDAMLARLAGTS